MPAVARRSLTIADYVAAETTWRAWYNNDAASSAGAAYVILGGSY